VEKRRETWSKSWLFVLAAAGSAVGLGNIWKFPYLAGENGGAAFTLVYLGWVVLVGLPLLIAEMIVGKASRLDPVGAYRKLSGGSKFWPWAGRLGVLTGFMILSFYSVVAGWSMAYVFKALAGEFNGFTTSAQAALAFDKFASSPVWPVIWHTSFMLFTITIVSRGVKGGLEQCNKILMPALFIILLGLVARALTLPLASEGVAFLWQPDFSKLNAEVVLIALGQACFTLSVGMGVMITYGSYLDFGAPLVRDSALIALTDTAVALLAGLAIFPAVFATGGEVAAGPQLIFVTLPVVFNHMVLGSVIGFFFFLFLTIAALTSAISLLEVPVTYLVDQKDISRPKAAIGVGLLIYLIGIPCAWSFGPLKAYALGGRTVFDWLDYLSSNLCLPLGGLLVAIFVGWRCLPLARFWFLASVWPEPRRAPTWLWLVWWLPVALLVPLAIIVILVAKLFGIG
jgi:NSS family neurotransmitter:Na+ symporter